MDEAPRDPIPLYNAFHDILKKAQNGWNLSIAALATKTNLEPDQITDVLEGDFQETIVRQLAPLLRLDADKLVECAQNKWHPSEKGVSRVERLHSYWGTMGVNAYLVQDPSSQKAALFDTGADSSAIVEMIRSRELQLEALFLTHTHCDHIAALELLRQATYDFPVYVHAKEPRIKNAHTFKEDDTFTLGDLTITPLLTSGHSPGGTTFVVAGFAQPVAIVGDALFASSMGKGFVSFREALKNNREKIFTLPDNTLLCPGHGPFTTVAKEKAHNPFYPEFKRPQANTCLKNP